MLKNKHFTLNGDLYRILSDDGTLVINRTKLTMPERMDADKVISHLQDGCVQVGFCTDTGAKGCVQDIGCAEDTVHTQRKRPFDDLSPNEKRIARERYTIIAPILAVMEDDRKRGEMIRRVASTEQISRATVRKYLCRYLAEDDLSALAPARTRQRELTEDEKNFRWALNKYYFTPKKQSLQAAYTLLLKEKYTDTDGRLVDGFPPFHRFKYYFTKHRKPESERISRNGLTEYQRNGRPLLGTITDFAPAVGVGMLDSTLCDIYLADESGKLVGRPVLTLCVDAYSRLICGYALSWENGLPALRMLLDNVVADKVSLCSRFSIPITSDQWSCTSVPGVLLTDNGREYTNTTFEQLTELGIRITNLPPYRPELKGIVEKTFDRIQRLFKTSLKGKGVIEPDFQERGAHDYREDACLTLHAFEKIIINCIVYCNGKSVLEGICLSQEMLDAGVQPIASSLFSYSAAQPGANLLGIPSDLLSNTLLPRTEGTFTRRGLVVNQQRYRHTEGNFTRRYLDGGTVKVAYDPDDIGSVWLFENGTYYEFELILKVYDGMSPDEARELKCRQKNVQNALSQSDMQAKIELTTEIERIADSSKRTAAENKRRKAVSDNG